MFPLQGVLSSDGGVTNLGRSTPFLVNMDLPGYGVAWTELDRKQTQDVLPVDCPQECRQPRPGVRS